MVDLQRLWGSLANFFGVTNLWFGAQLMRKDCSDSGVRDWSREDEPPSPACLCGVAAANKHDASRVTESTRQWQLTCHVAAPPNIKGSTTNAINKLGGEDWGCVCVVRRHSLRRHSIPTLLCLGPDRRRACRCRDPKLSSDLNPIAQKQTGDSSSWLSFSPQWWSTNCTPLPLDCKDCDTFFITISYYLFCCLSHAITCRLYYTFLSHMPPRSFFSLSFSSLLPNWYCLVTFSKGKHLLCFNIGLILCKTYFTKISEQ